MFTSPGVYQSLEKYLTDADVNSVAAAVNGNQRIDILSNYNDPISILMSFEEIAGHRIVTPDMKNAICNTYNQIQFEGKMPSFVADLYNSDNDTKFTIAMLTYYVKHDRFPICTYMDMFPIYVAILEIIVRIRHARLRSVLDETLSDFGKYRKILSLAYKTKSDYRSLHRRHWLHSFKRACVYLSSEDFSDLVLYLRNY